MTLGIKWHDELLKMHAHATFMAHFPGCYNYRRNKIVPFFFCTVFSDSELQVIAENKPEYMGPYTIDNLFSHLSVLAPYSRKNVNYKR